MISRVSAIHERLLPLCRWALVALSLAGCASNPTGGTDFVLMSESDELAKGEEMHEELMQEMPVYQDTALQNYVNEVGQRLVKASHRPDIDYTFTVIDSPEINAFALPGGYIYINRGLMAYLNAEAELAAVLGHELGHVTGRHAVRQDAARKTNNVLAGLLVVTTGVRELGETSALLGQTLTSGYGREMELEADSLGAEYLRKAGYDPNAIVSVIGTLKNQEDFSKRTGDGGNNYHGLFSTHPRNDTRLIRAVDSVGELDPKEALNPDPAVFRQRMTGLTMGKTRQTASNQDRNRYYQTLLNYTLIFPDNWQFEETTTRVNATAPEGDAALAVSAHVRKEENVEPRDYLLKHFGLETVAQGEELSQYGLRGYSGLDGEGRRLAVIYYGRRAFVFQGQGNEEAQEAIMASIHSFRPIARNERSAADPPALRYIQADGEVTYEELAPHMRMDGEHMADRLRLLNGDYPSGELTAGEWIKVVD